VFVRLLTIIFTLLSHQSSANKTHSLTHRAVWVTQKAGSVKL